MWHVKEKENLAQKKSEMKLQSRVSLLPRQVCVISNHWHSTFNCSLWASKWFKIAINLCCIMMWKVLQRFTLTPKFYFTKKSLISWKNSLMLMLFIFTNYMQHRKLNMLYVYHEWMVMSVKIQRRSNSTFDMKLYTTNFSCLKILQKQIFLHEKMRKGLIKIKNTKKKYNFHILLIFKLYEI